MSGDLLWFIRLAALITGAYATVYAVTLPTHGSRVVAAILGGLSLGLFVALEHRHDDD